MNSRYFSVGIFVLAIVGIIFFSGCIQVPPSEKIIFTAPTELPEATEGVQYSYSFCSPEITSLSDLCGDFEETTNPTQGNKPYYFTLGAGMGFPPFGITLNNNGLLAGTPTASGTRTFQVCAVDEDGRQACQTTSLTVIKPKTEIFEGTFSGPFGTTSSPNCQYSMSLSGAITLTLVQHNDGTISGTAEVPTEVGNVVTYSAPYADCTASPFSTTATGTVSGTHASFSGTFADNAERPLNIDFTGARSGNKITGSMTISRTFMQWWTDASGTYNEKYTPVSTTISIVLAKQE